MENSIVEEARKAIKEPKSIFIKRVPPEVRKAFVELADREFCRDYGMALKWLIDTVQWIPKLEDIEARLSFLERELNKKGESKKIVTISGRVLNE